MNRDSGARPPTEAELAAAEAWFDEVAARRAPAGDVLAARFVRALDGIDDEVGRTVLVPRGRRRRRLPVVAAVAATVLVAVLADTLLRPGPASDGPAATVVTTSPVRSTAPLDGLTRAAAQLDGVARDLAAAQRRGWLDPRARTSARAVLDQVDSALEDTAPSARRDELATASLRLRARIDALPEQTPQTRGAGNGDHSGPGSQHEGEQSGEH